MKNFKIILLGPLLLLGFLVPAFFVTDSALAYDPGCYSKTGTSSQPVFTSTNCPIEGAARAVSQFGACFIVVSSTEVNEVNCVDLTSSGNLVPISDGLVQTAELCGPSNIETEACKTDFEDDSKGCNEQELTKENCRIIEYLIIGINFLSAIAGIVIVASIMIAGFQYMTAQDNPGQIEKAKSRIIFTLLALVVFIFMYALLNFLVPGGVL